MKLLAISIKNWFFIAVLPTIVLLFILAFFYKPLNGPGRDHIYIRGTILENTSETTIITFEETSALWDETDFGSINKPLVLLNFQDKSMYAVGEKIIVRGDNKVRGKFKVHESFPDQFKPFTLDWRITLTALFLVLSTGSIAYSYLARK